MKRFLPTTYSTRLVFLGRCGFGTWNTRPLATVLCVLLCPLFLGQQASLLSPHFQGQVPWKEGCQLPCLHIPCPGAPEPRPPCPAQAEHQPPCQGPKGVASSTWVTEWGWCRGEPQLTLTIILQEWENILCEIESWAFGVRALTPKTLEYQRINCREYQIVRTHTKETSWIQDLASPYHQ